MTTANGHAADMNPRASFRRRAMRRRIEERGRKHVADLRAGFERCVHGSTFSALPGPRPYDVTIDGKHVVAKATLTAWEVHGWCRRIGDGNWSVSDE